MESNEYSTDRIVTFRLRKVASGVTAMLLSASLLAGCMGMTGGAPADATATVEPAPAADDAAEDGTETPEVDDTETMTDTEGIGDSETTTGTEGMDDSETMTDTEGTGGTDDGEGITDTEDITGTDTTTN